jgi:hypothetical protein
MVSDQIRFHPSTGTPIGLDVASISSYFKTVGVKDLERQCKKMKIIFEELYLGEKTDK